MLIFLRNLPVWFYLSFYISLYLLFVSLTAYCICNSVKLLFPFFLPNRLTFFLFPPWAYLSVDQSFRLYFSTVFLTLNVCLPVFCSICLPSCLSVTVSVSFLPSCLPFHRSPVFLAACFFSSRMSACLQSFMACIPSFQGIYRGEFFSKKIWGPLTWGWH